MARTKERPKAFILQDNSGFHVVLLGSRSIKRQTLEKGQRNTTDNNINRGVHRLLQNSQGIVPQADYLNKLIYGTSSLASRSLKTATSTAVKLIDNYFKTGTLHISERNVLSILEVAGKLRLTIIYDACLLLLSKALTIGNWKVIWRLANKSHCHALKNAITKFTDRHFSKCFTRKDTISLTGSLTHDKIDLQSLAYLLLHCQLGLKQNTKHRKSLARMMCDVLSTEATMWKVFFKDYFQTIDNKDVHNFSHHVVQQTTITTKHATNEGTVLSNLPVKEFSTVNEIPGCQSITTSRDYTGILVTGGVTNATNPEPLDCVFVYKPATSAWVRLPCMTCARYNHTLVSLGNIVLAIGGNNKQSLGAATVDDCNQTQISSVEQFSFKLNKWTEVTSMILRREEHCSVAVRKQVYTIGGHDGVSQLCSVEKYSPKYNWWRLESPMYRLHTGATAVTDGQNIFIIGGYDGINWLNTIECYDTLTKTWAIDQYPPMATKRGYAGAQLVMDDIFVFGGTSGYENLTSCEVFNLRNKQWRIGPSLNQARLNAAHCMIEGKILVMGGESNGTFVDTVEQLDIQIWSWRILCKMPIKAAGLRCITLTD